MAPVRALENAVARHLAAVLGARPEIAVYTDGAAEPFEMYVGTVAGFPSAGVATLSTIGAAKHPVHAESGDEHPTRLEFIGSCKTNQEADFAEALVTAARYIGPGKGEAYPGMVLEGLFGAFRRHSPVPHAMLDHPFAYDGLLKVEEFAGVRVTWLQAVPVSTREIEFAKQHSVEALREALEKAAIAWEDLDRPSIR